MDFNSFKQKIYQQFGLNLDGYKEKQLKRRIDSLMCIQQVEGYDTYYRLLLSNEEQRRKFLDRITINVSEFFRNQEIFAILEQQIIPAVLHGKPRLRIWSAACSNGAEPYSVAMILDEQGRGATSRIQATDIDDKILAVAKEAKYDQSALRNVTPKRLSTYFTAGDGGYWVKDSLKRRVAFAHHDLLTDPFDRGFDLIICRNVTIYFTQEIQHRLYHQFYDALNPGGVLFIGATESILQYREFGFQKISPWFYEKNV